MAISSCGATGRRSSVPLGRRNPLGLSDARCMGAEPSAPTRTASRAETGESRSPPGQALGKPARGTADESCQGSDRRDPLPACSSPERRVEERHLSDSRRFRSSERLGFPGRFAAKTMVEVNVQEFKSGCLVRTDHPREVLPRPKLGRPPLAMAVGSRQNLVDTLWTHPYESRRDHDDRTPPRSLTLTGCLESSPGPFGHTAHNRGVAGSSPAPATGERRLH